MYSCVDSKVFVGLKCTPSFLKVDMILNLCQWLTIFSGNDILFSDYLNCQFISKVVVILIISSMTNCIFCFNQVREIRHCLFFKFK